MRVRGQATGMRGRIPPKQDHAGNELRDHTKGKSRHQARGSHLMVKDVGP